MTKLISWPYIDAISLSAPRIWKVRCFKTVQLLNTTNAFADDSLSTTTSPGPALPMMIWRTMSERPRRSIEEDGKLLLQR